MSSNTISLAVFRSDPNFDVLCARCRAFDIRAFYRTPTRRKAYRLQDVEVDANEGCGFCKLLLDAVQDAGTPSYFYVNGTGFGWTYLKRELYVYMTVSESYKSQDLEKDRGQAGLRANRLLVEVGDRYSEARNRSSHEICLAADADSPAARSQTISGRYIGTDPAATATFQTIQAWLDECASHKKCRTTVSGAVRIDAKDSPLPTRVVEMVREANGQRKFYLRMTEGLHGAYITLTHRWNALTSRSSTTATNYSARLIGTGFEEIPQLFQDTFTIAEKLGIQFVWIDSLCIIQQGDDLADWRREAPKMAQYYQFSIFTLAGTGDDMSHGILQADHPTSTSWSLPSKLVKLPYRNEMGHVDGSFYVYRRRVPLVDEYFEEVRTSILFRRGWILQEWLLSKRLLWYTPGGLFFECQEELPRAAEQSQLVYGRVSTELQAHLKLKEWFHEETEDILGFWYRVIEVYSAMDLTKPEQDRILAVAGLAKEVGAILLRRSKRAGAERSAESEVCIAGLWLRDIAHGLLWEDVSMDSDIAPRDVPGTPSWSWASQMTPVSWPERCKDMKNALQVTGVCFRNHGPHILPTHLISTERESPELKPVASGNSETLDLTNMFACLHVRGHIHTVHVRGFLTTADELKDAATLTGYSPIPHQHRNWRAVCSAFRPETIAGWASLERLRFNTTRNCDDRDDVPLRVGCDDYGMAVYALRVGERYFEYGRWITNKVPVIDVLFLERVPETQTNSVSRRFRRLGLGRIADVGLIAEFDRAAEWEVQLI